MAEEENKEAEANKPAETQKSPTVIVVPPPPPIPGPSEKVKTMLESAEIAAASKSGGNFIKRAWKGQEKLWKVFWLYGFLGVILLNIVLSILTSALGSMGSIVAAVITLTFALWNLVSCWRCAWNVGAKFWGVIVRILVVISAIVYLLMILTMAGLSIGVSSMMDAQKAMIKSQAIVAPVAPTSSSSPVVPTPAAPQPVPPQAATPTPDTAPAPIPTMDACEKRMYDYAVQNGADAKAYVAQNQAYLTECRKVLAGQKK